MSHSNSPSPSDSGSSVPENQHPPSGNLVPLSSTATLSPVSELPCQYQPSCPDQCPGFQPSQNNPLYCISPESGSGKRSATLNSSRWLEKVDRIKNGQNIAKAKVHAGFHGQGKGKGRAVSTPVPNLSVPPAAPSQPSGSRSRKASKSNSSSPEPIYAIYFVENAHSYITSATNNQGKKLRQFVKVPVLNNLDKSNLQGTLLARVHKDNDPLTLDPTLSPEETAQRLADWFPVLYNFVNPSGGPAPVDWCYELIKYYHELNSTNSAEGLPASRQLLDRVFMKARDKKTREIYLAVTKELTNAVRIQLGLPKVKRARSDSDSEDKEAPKVARTRGGSRLLRSTNGRPGTNKKIATPASSSANPLVSRSPSLEPVAEQSTPPAAVPGPPSPAATELFHGEIEELEAATSSFMLDDDSDVEIVASGPSVLTRSKQALCSAAVVPDPVMAAFASDKLLDPFADDYDL
ncbi:hypothetical protein FRC08_010705, partial [Ceratobasidium sp. 394]